MRARGWRDGLGEEGMSRGWHKFNLTTSRSARRIASRRTEKERHREAERKKGRGKGGGEARTTE